MGNRVVVRLNSC